MYSLFDLVENTLDFNKFQNLLNIILGLEQLCQLRVVRIYDLFLLNENGDNCNGNGGPQRQQLRTWQRWVTPADNR